MRTALLLFIILMGFGHGAPASAEKLVVAYSNFPPLVGARKSHPGEKGLLVEFYEKVLPELGYDVELRQLPPARISRLMDAGEQIDLYSCADFLKEKREHYVFGPRFTHVNIDLFQNKAEPILSRVGDLQDAAILKQQGFNGLKRPFHESNRFIDADYESLISMFARGRANYLVGFRERLVPLIADRKTMPEYRTYHIRAFNGHVCLHRRFEEAERRVLEIHFAMVAWQYSPEGQALFEKYRYAGRFGH